MTKLIMNMKRSHANIFGICPLVWKVKTVAFSIRFGVAPYFEAVSPYWIQKLSTLNFVTQFFWTNIRKQCRIHSCNKPKSNNTSLTYLSTYFLSGTKLLIARFSHFPTDKCSFCNSLRLEVALWPCSNKSCRRFLIWSETGSLDSTLAVCDAWLCVALILHSVVNGQLQSINHNSFTSRWTLPDLTTTACVPASFPIEKKKLG